MSILYPDDLLIPLDVPPLSESIGITVSFSVLFCLAWSIVIIRLFTKYFYSRLQWDDFFIVLSTLMFSVFVSSVIAMEIIAWGKNALTVHTINQLTDILLISESTYLWAMIFLKVSLAIWFWRLMHRTWQKIIISFMIFVTVVIGVAYFFFTIFQCGYPGTSNGLPFFIRKVEALCVQNKPAYAISYMHAGINAITDIVFCALPLPALWRAKFNKKEKIVMCTIIIIASSSSICSIIRIAYTDGLANTSIHFLITLQVLAIVAALEIGLGIVAASLVTLRPLLAKIAIWVGARKSKNGSSTQYWFEDADQLMAMNSAQIGSKSTDSKSNRRSGKPGENNLNFLISQTLPTTRYHNEKDMEKQSVEEPYYVLPGFNPSSPLPPLSQDSQTSSIASPLPEVSNNSSKTRTTKSKLFSFSSFDTPKASAIVPFSRSEKESTKQNSQGSSRGSRWWKSKKSDTSWMEDSQATSVWGLASSWGKQTKNETEDENLSGTRGTRGTHETRETNKTQETHKTDDIQPADLRDELEIEESESPPLEEGYRKWVIERPSVPDTTSTPKYQPGRLGAWPRNHGRY